MTTQTWLTLITCYMLRTWKVLAHLTINTTSGEQDHLHFTCEQNKGREPLLLPISPQPGVGKTWLQMTALDYVVFLERMLFPVCVSTVLASGLCVVNLAVIVSLRQFLTGGARLERIEENGSRTFALPGFNLK